MEENQTLDNKPTDIINDYDFPFSLQFKIGTLANDFVAKDSWGRTFAYVRQKMFKFKEAILVYSDESKTKVLYKINADRVIDFNARYTFYDANDIEIGSVGRKGMKSLWKANYDVFDNNKQVTFTIREENGWTKVFDSLLGQIPVLGMFTGYFLNPTYGVTDANGVLIARLSKEASFFGRKFTLDKLENASKADVERILLAIMMMVLLERRRG